jgi:uncharacterized membrane protein YphA (DoxX/SURF4 family)
VQLLILTAFLILGCFLSFIIKPNAKFDHSLTLAYITVAALLVFNAALVNFMNIQNASIMNVLLFVLNWGKSLHYLLIGYLMISIFQVLKLHDTASNNYPMDKIIKLTLWALTIINGCSFIIETGYKLKNFDDLVAQFASYGYALWFLYFIILTETLGGIGILLHFKWRTGPLATLGLMIIMLGVVYTNWHTNNPFAFSSPAVDAFMSLSLMMILYNFEKRVNYQSATA